jgi:hypothetical protein
VTLNRFFIIRYPLRVFPRIMGGNKTRKAHDESKKSLLKFTGYAFALFDSGVPDAMIDGTKDKTNLFADGGVQTAMNTSSVRFDGVAYVGNDAFRQKNGANAFDVAEAIPLKLARRLPDDLLDEVLAIEDSIDKAMLAFSIIITVSQISRFDGLEVTKAYIKLVGRYGHPERVSLFALFMNICLGARTSGCTLSAWVDSIVANENNWRDPQTV